MDNRLRFGLLFVLLCLIVSIIPECTALFTVGLFACFVGAYPASRNGKILGLLVGLPFLYALNLARLHLIFLAGWVNQRLFDFVHVYLGQVLSVCFVFIACGLWLKHVAQEGESAGGLREAMAFSVRFFCVSAVLFLIWIKLNRGYVWLVDEVMIRGFDLFGQRIEVTRQLDLYYPTFSVVTLVTIIMRTFSQ